MQRTITVSNLAGSNPSVFIAADQGLGYVEG